MIKIDKNTCFDLKQLSLFVKSELSDCDLNKISKHLEDCEGCSETVENVKSFYLVDGEEKIADFSSSKKELTLITFKYIFKENFSLLKNKIGVALNSLSSLNSNTDSGIEFSKGSKPILTFSTSVTLSIVAMIFCISILYSPITGGFIPNDKEIAKEENGNKQLVQNSVIANHYKEKKDQINQLMLHAAYDGILSGPLDDMVDVRNGGISAMLN